MAASFYVVTAPHAYSCPLHGHVKMPRISIIVIVSIRIFNVKKINIFREISVNSFTTFLNFSNELRNVAD